MCRRRHLVSVRGDDHSGCVFDVYARVYERFSHLLRSGDYHEIRLALTNLNALAGTSRAAAGLASIDAHAGRPARTKAELCRSVCLAAERDEWPLGSR